MNLWWKQHQKSIRNSSILTYSKIIKYIKENLETDVLIKNIDIQYLQKFMNNLPHSYEYRKKFKSVFNMVFNYAIDMEYLDNNPVQRLTVIKPALTKETFENTSNKFLEKEEMNLILDILYGSFQSYSMGRLAEFMYLTGIRFGEAVSLTISDINLITKTASINGTLDYSGGYQNATKQLPKTMSSYRELGLSKRAIEIIEELIIEREVKFNNKCDFLFVGKTGKPIQLNSFNASLKKTNEKLGDKKIDKDISSHIFRHSHISLLSELDVNIKAIMERVGHSDVDTTMKIYTHVTKKSRNSIIDKLDSL